MKNEYIDRILAAKRNHALVSTLKWGLGRVWPFRFITNKVILESQQRDILYKKLCRRYRHMIDQAPPAGDTAAPFPKTIWWCWLQGYDQAPELVKCCYESLRRNIKGYEIKIVTSENLSDYIILPDYITEKFKKGVICAAHYSDIIRLELLIRYGGIWIDATVLCTDDALCSEIEKAPLFVYRTNASNVTLAANWFISAVPCCPILTLTRDLLVDYWKKRNMAEHYFIFYLFFTIALRKYPEIWGRVPRHSNASPHMLSHEINDMYSDERYAVIKRFSSFHKLSYKTEYLPERDTFYNVLVGRREY